jgi:outer membrane protein assembly factor BamE
MRILPLALALTCTLSGCASMFHHDEAPPPAAPATGTQATELTLTQKVIWTFSPYRISIQQGNFVSQEMVAQIKEGMTREQVRFVLGTPLLTDVFHADRWDYPFRLQRGNGEVLSSRVAVHFKDGFVTRFEGGNLPNEREYIARIAGSAVQLLRAESDDIGPKKEPKK